MELSAFENPCCSYICDDGYWIADLLHYISFGPELDLSPPVYGLMKTIHF